MTTALTLPCWFSASSREAGALFHRLAQERAHASAVAQRGTEITVEPP
jgi:hypothetical protein